MKLDQLKRLDGQMDVRTRDIISAAEFRNRLQLNTTREILQIKRLLQSGHLKTITGNLWPIKCAKFEAVAD